jgi:hypothetical protein
VPAVEVPPAPAPPFAARVPAAPVVVPGLPPAPAFAPLPAPPVAGALLPLAAACVPAMGCVVWPVCIVPSSSPSSTGSVAQLVPTSNTHAAPAVHVAQRCLRSSLFECIDAEPATTKLRAFAIEPRRSGMPHAPDALRRHAAANHRKKQGFGRDDARPMRAPAKAQDMPKSFLRTD